MADKRLPIVDQDDGAWGTILNDFLGKEHYDVGAYDPNGGGHKTVTLQAGAGGTAAAPLTFTSGSLISAASAVAGAVEFYNGRFYLTATNGTLQKAIATYADDGTNGATGDIYYRDASANFVRLPVGSSGDVLKLAGSPVIPSWVAPTQLTQQQVMAITSMRI